MSWAIEKAHRAVSGDAEESGQSSKASPPQQALTRFLNSHGLKTMSEEQNKDKALGTFYSVVIKYPSILLGENLGKDERQNWSKRS